MNTHFLSCLPESGCFFFVNGATIRNKMVDSTDDSLILCCNLRETGRE